NLIGDRRAVILSHDVQAEVGARRLPGGGEDVALVDVQGRRIYADLGVALGEGARVHPVRRRAPAVEEAGRGQYDGAGADRRDAGAPPGCCSDRVDQLLRRLQRFIVAGGDDDGVRGDEVGVAVRRCRREPTVHPGALGGAAHPQLVPVVGQVRPVGAKDRARRRELEYRHPVTQCDGNNVGHDRNCTVCVISATGPAGRCRRMLDCMTWRTLGKDARVGALGSGWLRPAIAVAAIGWGANQFAPLIVLYQRHGVSVAATEVMFGLYAVGLVPALMVGGRWSDRAGRRAVWLAALALSLVASLVLMAGSAWHGLLFPGRLVVGVSSGLAFGTGAAWIRELSAVDAQHHAGPRRATIAMTIGFGGGPLVAGI